MGRLEQAALALFVVSLFNAAFSFLSSLAFRVAGERIVRRIRRALFASLLLQEVAFFDRTMTGVCAAEHARAAGEGAHLTLLRRQELVNRLSSDCTKLSDLMTVDIAMTLRWVATIAGSAPFSAPCSSRWRASCPPHRAARRSGIVYLFIVSWRLSLVMVSVVPFVGVAARMFGSYVRALGRKEQDALADATTTASESLTHIRTVKAFGQEVRGLRRSRSWRAQCASADVNRSRSRYRCRCIHCLAPQASQEELYGSRVDAAYAIGVRVAWALALFRSLLGAVANSVLVLLLYLGGLWTIDGYITVGGLSSFMLFSVQIGAAFAGIAGMFGKVCAPAQIWTRSRARLRQACERARVLWYGLFMPDQCPRPHANHGSAHSCQRRLALRSASFR